MKLVKILTDDDGDKRDDPKWCLVSMYGDAHRTVCSGEAFGEGESSATFKEKETEKGGITCPRCLAIIKWYKSLKL